MDAARHRLGGVTIQPMWVDEEEEEETEEDANADVDTETNRETQLSVDAGDKLATAPSPSTPSTTRIDAEGMIRAFCHTTLSSLVARGQCDASLVALVVDKVVPKVMARHDGDDDATYLAKHVDGIRKLLVKQVEHEAAKIRM